MRSRQTCDRHPVGRLEVPGDLLDAEPGRSPRVNTVPLKRNTSGISPSRRAWRYFAAATSKSYVQVIGRSTSMLPENPRTIVDACVQRNGVSVFAHCSGSRRTARSGCRALGPVYGRRCGSIRTWQRSAIAWIGCAAGLLDPQLRPAGSGRRRTARAGCPARRRRAGSCRWLRSRDRLRRSAAGLDAVEERVERRLRVASAVEPSPQRPQLARPARSRRRSGRGSTRRRSHRDVRAEASTSGSRVAERGVGRHQLLPGAERQLGLGRAGRARVERDRAWPSWELWKKNAIPTGICSSSHCAGPISKHREGQIALGHGAVGERGVLCGEQQIAASTCAHQ